MLMVGYCDRHLSVVMRRPSSTFSLNHLQFSANFTKKLSLDGPVPICKKFYEWNLSRLNSNYVADIPSLAVLYVFNWPQYTLHLKYFC